MTTEQLWLVAYDYGYADDLGVVFTSEELADAHAVQTGGFAVPVVRMNRLPKQRTRYSYHTRIARGGIIKRSDFTEQIEWEYERIWAEPTETRNHVIPDNLTGETSLFTIGYEPTGVEAEHTKLIDHAGGIIP